jgi:hypothetical protein
VFSIPLCDPADEPGGCTNHDQEKQNADDGQASNVPGQLGGEILVALGTRHFVCTDRLTVQ